MHSYYMYTYNHTLLVIHLYVYNMYTYINMFIHILKGIPYNKCMPSLTYDLMANLAFIQGQLIYT